MAAQEKVFTRIYISAAKGDGRAARRVALDAMKAVVPYSNREYVGLKSARTQDLSGAHYIVYMTADDLWHFNDMAARLSASAGFDVPPLDVYQG